MEFLVNTLAPIASTAGYIIICVLLFSLAIAIHEFGHFIVALKLGLNVERFSIGFGPAIWKKTYKGVEYRISWIPLGGYVSIPDVDPDGTKALEGEAKRGARAQIPAWKEICVAVAGPLMNIVLAVVLAVILSLSPAEFGVIPPIIDSVEAGSPAEDAGIQQGDCICAIDGQSISTWTELLTEVQIAGGRTVDFRIQRATGEAALLPVTPIQVDGIWRIGAKSRRTEMRAAAWMTSRNPFEQLKDDAGSIFRVLKALVTPKQAKATSEALGGPVMIAMGIYTSVRHDFWSGLGFLRYLNVNLAILNLLPIPVLDGGLILFALIAMVFRRRIPEKVISTVSMVFMYALLGVMLLLIYRDSIRGVRMFRKAAAEPPAQVETVIEHDNAQPNPQP